MTSDKPFPRIVVPTDGSLLSRSAAQAAATFARQVGVPLTLFGVTYDGRARDELVQDLDGLVETLRRDLVVDVVIDAVGPVMKLGTYVADSILDEADMDGAVVCLATHGHSGLGAALLGSTAEEVLRRSSRPVLVVGPRYESRPWRTEGMVVACLDGSPFAEQALPAATAWATTLDQSLWFVQVAAPQSGPPSGYGGDLNETAYLRSLTQGDPHIDYDVLHSKHPAHELADLAERWPVNLMVMATHGRSGWSRLTIGSVAMNVVHRATCPVLLVRPQNQAGTKVPTG